MVSLNNIKNASKVAAGLSLKLVNKELGARLISSTLSSVPGVSAKITQLLNTNSDASDQAPIEITPMNKETVLSIIENETPNLAAMIADISFPPIVASVGQLHRVTLKNGVELAVKIQYEGLSKTVEQQLHVLFGAMSFGPPKKFGLNIDDYKNTVGVSISEELDYDKELKNQQKMFKLYEFDPRVTIAAPSPYYSGTKVLSQSWLPSENEKDIRLWSQKERLRACSLFAEYFLDAVFIKKFLHIDLHPNNFGFTKSDQGEISLVLYDFGAVLSLDPRKVQALWSLINLHMDPQKKPPIQQVADHLVYLGFDEQKLAHLGPRLGVLVDHILLPFTKMGPWKPQDWTLNETAEKTLGNDKWWFRTAGPAWFILLMRAANGLVKFLTRQGFGYNTRNLFEKMSKFYIPISITLPSTQFKDGSEECASHLKIHVSQNKETIVSTSLPYRVIDEIRDYIPEDSLKEIEQSLNLNSLVEKVIASGYVPQLIFEQSLENGKKYKVWLE